MAVENVKNEAQDLIDSLPDDATWEDLMEKIYVRQSIEEGLNDSNAGKTIDVSEVRKQFNLAS